MWGQVEGILRQAMSQIADHIADFLPGLVVAFLLILATFLVASLVRQLLVRALQRARLRPACRTVGLSACSPAGRRRPARHRAVARIVYWTLLVLGLLVSLTALNATIPSRLALTVFNYLPHLLAALLILVVGGIAARFLARSALIGAVNMQIQSARLLSLIVKWLVLLVTVAMALDHLGIGRSILLLAFAILFGGIVLAAALAVGLGARDVVARTLERQVHAPQSHDDTVNHV